MTIHIPFKTITKLWDKFHLPLVLFLLSAVSVYYFWHYLNNGLGLAYNDARSHLDIGRRVVEGLKPGLAQIGSVWLPLPHLLMIPTVWNDTLWHTGFSGAIVNMISFVFTGLIIYKTLARLGVGKMGRIFGVIVFAANLNILYLQATAMTELLLLATLSAGTYYLIAWHQEDDILHLIKAAFWIMLATLVRYDGWFLLAFAGALIIVHVLRRRGYQQTEGTFFLFGTLSGLGVVLWLLWNLLIFKDPLYFALGPFSAHAQQLQLESAGVLATKHNLYESLRVYFYALVFNSGGFNVIIGLLGMIAIFADRSLKVATKIASTVLISPFLFNILALYLGHSVLFVQGLAGDTWFNARYGIMLMPSIAIFAGFLLDRSKSYKLPILGLFLMVTFFSFRSGDAVTIDDATVGSSQKNVTEVSKWLAENTANKPGFILISVASHDAIIFSSGLPMAKFIHEGTGAYWESATIAPDRWARWIVMRTYDDNDLAFRYVKDAPGYVKYRKVNTYPFADIYELKEEYLSDLNTTPAYANQK